MPSIKDTPQQVSPDLDSSVRTSVLGVGVSAVNLDTATQTILGWIDRSERKFVTVTDVHGLIQAQDSAEFKKILNSSGMTVPDGMPLVWLSQLAGHPEVSRVCGYDFTLTLSQALALRKGRVFYYGGAPGVAEQLAKNLEARFPGLETAGTYSPPYRDLNPEEEEKIFELINSSRADVLWVGLSTPKQERWMSRYRSKLNVPALIGVGAVFDFLTGRVKRAPAWIQQTGFEWLYRVSQEPRRLLKRYLRTHPRFVYYIACEKLKLRRFDA